MATTSPLERRRKEFRVWNAFKRRNSYYDEDFVELHFATDTEPHRSLRFTFDEWNEIIERVQTLMTGK